MVLLSKSFLGINFYTRTRLYEKKMDFTPSKIHCDDIGLYIIGKDPDLEYNFVTITEKKEWNLIAADTINLAILNLVLSGTIEIHEFQDEKAYLFKLIKKKIVNYRLQIIDNSNNEDFLTNSILNATSKIANSGDKIKDLSKVISKLLDSYLGANSEYSRPEKHFIVEILKKYSKKHDWLKIVSKKKMLGIYKDHKIEINRIYIPRISMQHENLIDYHSAELQKSLDYRVFRGILREILYEDFQKRLPQDHD